MLKLVNTQGVRVGSSDVFTNEIVFQKFKDRRLLALREREREKPVVYYVNEYSQCEKILHYSIKE